MVSPKTWLVTRQQTGKTWMNDDVLIEVVEDRLALAARKNIYDGPIEVGVAEFAIPRSPR